MVSEIFYLKNSHQIRRGQNRSKKEKEDGRIRVFTQMAAKLEGQCRIKVILLTNALSKCVRKYAIIVGSPHKEVKTRKHASNLKVAE